MENQTNKKIEENKTKWMKLLSAERVNNSSPNEEKQRNPFLIDVDRIIYSTYFRTLQDKTQVHPLIKSSKVRTRLTHSLEVSRVGRSLGYSVGLEVIQKYNLSNVTEHDVGYILQAACLAHDIGNPPFGHVGEDAIKYFFTEKNTILYKTLSDSLTKEELDNLQRFDGNPQGFRIITKLAPHAEHNGLDLTYATLGTFLKYPNSYAHSKDSKDKLEIPIGTNKLGVFTYERDILTEIATKLGLINLKGDHLIFYRHPLAFLLEAADDICYLIADIEDAHSVGLTPIGKVEDLLVDIVINDDQHKELKLQNLRENDCYKNISSDDKKVEYLRGKAIGKLINEVAKVFINHEEAILEGKIQNSLLKLSKYKDVMKECKDYASNYIFQSSDKTASEIKGIKATQTLLEELCNSIIHKDHPKSKRIQNLIPIGLSNDKKITYSSITKMLDFISSCTDSQLLDLYKILEAN